MVPRLLQTTIWNWGPGSQEVSDSGSISPLCLDFLICEMRVGELVMLTHGKALLGNTGCHPDTMAESALGLEAPPASDSPSLNQESATFLVLWADSSIPRPPTTRR